MIEQGTWSTAIAAHFGRAGSAVAMLQPVGRNLCSARPCRIDAPEGTPSRVETSEGRPRRTWYQPVTTRALWIVPEAEKRACPDGYSCPITFKSTSNKYFAGVLTPYETGSYSLPIAENFGLFSRTGKNAASEVGIEP